MYAAIQKPSEILRDTQTCHGQHDHNSSIFHLIRRTSFWCSGFCVCWSRETARVDDERLGLGFIGMRTPLWGFWTEISLVFERHTIYDDPVLIGQAVGCVCPVTGAVDVVFMVLFDCSSVGVFKLSFLRPLSNGWLGKLSLSLALFVVLGFWPENGPPARVIENLGYFPATTPTCPSWPHICSDLLVGGNSNAVTTQ